MDVEPDQSISPLLAEILVAGLMLHAKPGDKCPHRRPACCVLVPKHARDLAISLTTCLVSTTLRFVPYVYLNVALSRMR